MQIIPYFIAVEGDAKNASNSLLCLIQVDP